MALFTLTDIRFNSDKNRTSNKIIGDKYKINTLRYPIDLGEVDKGHYMVIHVNQQRRTQFSGATFDDETTAVQNRLGLNRFNGGGSDFISITQGAVTAASQLNLAQISENIQKKYKLSAGSPELQRLLQKTQDVYSASGLKGVSEYFADNAATYAKTGLRTTKRTTDTIALYMPDTLAFTQNQHFAGLELGGGLAATLGAGFSGIQNIVNSDASNTQKANYAFKNATPFVLNALANMAGQAGRAVFAGFTGTTVNPMMEVIYSAPEFRSFRFDFMFYPRSRIEAKEVQNIIQRIRFHQAPEVLGNNSAGGLGGYFLVPPSEFDIKFYYNGAENPNIPSISTCVLQTVDVDYAPSGFAAYEVLEDKGIPTTGSTGMPVGIRLGLMFKETQIITKFDLSQEADRNGGRNFFSQAENEMGPRIT
jgi:hypothetical protein